MVPSNNRDRRFGGRELRADGDWHSRAAAVAGRPREVRLAGFAMGIFLAVATHKGDN